MSVDKENLDHTNIVPFIEDIFLRRGAEEYLGESVTIAEHMLQCAELAQNEGASDDVVAAALLHDIGHFTNEFPRDAAEQGIDSVHEEAGAQVIHRFFPELVHECVKYHVAAKRYLCATDDSYFSQLSEASVLSLKLQGGPMSEAECDEFAKNPHLKAILQVRVWDDLGKDADHKAPDFQHFRPILERVAHSVAGGAA